MTKPIKPEEVASLKATLFPEWVFRAFNECIAENLNGNRATVKQDEVIDKMMHFAGWGNTCREEIFEKGYLNVEDVYREAGWKVEYDKPGYNESYGAFFVFKVK